MEVIAMHNSNELDGANQELVLGPIQDFRTDIMGTSMGHAEMTKFVPNHKKLDAGFWPFPMGRNSKTAIEDVNSYYILYTLANNIFVCPGLDEYDERTEQKLIDEWLSRHRQHKKEFMGLPKEKLREAMLELAPQASISKVRERYIELKLWALPSDTLEGVAMDKIEDKVLVSTLLTTCQCHPHHAMYHHGVTSMIIGEILNRIEGEE